MMGCISPMRVCFRPLHEAFVAQKHCRVSVQQFAAGATALSDHGPVNTGAMS